MIPLQVLFFLGYILPRDLIEKESETDPSIFCVVCFSLLSLEPLQARIGDSNFISHQQTSARLSVLFITLTFENYERCFFYEILNLIKTKNINVCCFKL